MTSTESIYELFQHIGFQDYRNAAGDLVVELPVAPHVVNTNGGLQGGLIATLVDIAAGKRSVVMQVDITSLPDEELAAIATVSFATIRRSA